MLTEAQRKRAQEIRAAMDVAVPAIAGDTKAVNTAMPLIRPWAQGVYAVGDVRMYGGTPYKCVQAHDSTAVANWTPEVASLWIQYHGTSAASARAWIAPTGAHDMYKAGEYMVFTDGKTYKCVSDTAYSPTDYAQAWQAQ